MATTDPIYNLNGKKVTLTQIKESAALHGIPPEEYITKFGAVLTGKTTDSANATDPRVESGNTGSTSEEDFSVSRLGNAEVQLDEFGDPVTIKAWEEETKDYIDKNPDLTADELSKWINRPGGPTESQYSFQEGKEIFKANKEDPKLDNPNYSPSNFIIDLYEDPGFNKNKPALSAYDNELEFLKNKQKDYSIMSTESADIQSQINQLEYNKENELENNRTATSRARNSFTQKINEADTYWNDNQAKFQSGEITPEEFATVERNYNNKRENIFQNSYEKDRYEEQTLLLDEISTAKTKDTYSSFGSSDLGESKEEQIKFDQKVEDEIINKLYSDNKLKGKTLDGNLNLEGKEMLITEAKSKVLNQAYEDYLTEYNKAQEIIFASEESATIIPEVANAAQSILYKAANNLQATSTKLAFNIGEQSFDNNFQMTEDFIEWRDRHIDGGFVGGTQDFIGTLVQGGQKIIGESIVGSAIWLNRLAFTGMGTFEEDEYSRLDMVSDMFSNYNSFNYMGVSPKGGSLSEDGISFRSASKTIANMLPFTIGVALAARKGDMKGLKNAYSVLRGMGASASTINKIKMGGFAFRATVNDNYMEGKQMGLDDAQALAYSSMTSTATAVVQGIMPDVNFFKTNVGKSMLSTVVENLKKATTKEARKAVGKQFVNNLLGEIGEEEAELLLQDMAKITVGLSNETKFTDWYNTQFETIGGTILLAGGTSTVMAPAQFSNFKNKIYNQYRTQGTDIIKTLQESKKVVETKLKRARTQQSKDAAQRQLDEINSAIEYGGDIIKAINVAPDVMNDEQIDLLIQKNQLLDKKAKADKRYTKGVDAEIEAIDAKIEASQVKQQSSIIEEKTEAGTKKIADALGITFTKGNTQEITELIAKENVAITERNIEKKDEDKEDLIDAEEALAQNGFIIQNEDGTQSIVVNEDVAGTNKAVTTAQHELLHGVLLKTITDNPGAIIQMSNALKSEIDKMIPTGVSFNNSYIQGRLEAYKEKPSSVQAEELLTIFSEGLTQGYISFEENTFTKIGDFIRQGLQKAGMNVTFNSGRDVFNFIKDFNKSVISGKGLGKGLTKAAKRGVKVGKKLGNTSAFLYDANFEANIKAVYNDTKIDLPKRALKIAIAYRPRMQELMNKSSNSVFGTSEKFQATEYALIGKNNANSILNTVLNYNPSSDISLDETIGRTIFGIGETAVTQKYSREADKAKSVLDEINTLVPSSVKTQEDYFKPRVFNPIYKATEPNGVISNYIKSKSPSKEVAKKTIASIQERLVNYDPAAERKKAGNKQPITFGEFIFANTNFGKLDAKKALFKESEDAKKTTDLDNKEAQSIANEEGPGPTADNRKTYVSFVNTPKMIPNFIVTEVKTKLVDVISKLTSKLSTRPKGPNAQTTPLIAEIKKAISDVVGDPNALPKQIIKRMGKGTGDSYKAYLIANKKTILENLTTTYLQTAIPVAVEKSVGGKFRTDKNGVKLNDKGGKWKPGDVGVFDTKFVPYPEWVGKKIDREKVDTDKKGSTSGNDFVRRIEVSDDVFVANFIGQESRKDETKKLGLGKAIAEEVGFEVLTREIAKEDSDIRKAFNKNQKALKEVLVDNIVEQISRDVERGNVKFSLSAMTPDMRLKFLAGTEMFHERIMNLEKINKPNIKKIFLATYNSNDFSPAVIDGIAAQFAKRLGPVSKAREMVSIPEFKQILIQISNQTDETLALQKLAGAAMNATEVFADEDNIIISRGAVIENMQMLIDDLGVDEGLQLIIAFGSSTFSSQGAIGLLKFDLKLQKLVRGLRADGRPITKAGADLFSGSEDLLQSLYNTLDLGGKRIERIENKEIFFSDGTAVARKYSPVTSVTQGMLKEGYVPDAVNYKAAQKFVTSFFENFAKQDLDPNVALTLLSTFNNGTSNALRAAARVWGKSTTMPYKTIKVNGKRVYIYEHAIPARVVLAYLYEYHVNGNKDINIEALWDDYRVTIIPIEEMDNVLTNAGFSSITTSDYVPGKSPWYNRYYNLFTRGRMPYAMVSYDGKETVGKAYEQYFNEKGKKPLIKANATQELSAIKIQQKAIDNGRSIKWSLSPKKIRVFDFDDTLARTKNNVLYTMPDGTKGKIDAATFAKDAGKMEAEGAVWDFSEFSKVMNGKAGPLLGVAKIIADKRGTKDVFVLTARPSSAAGPIQQFLSSLGLNIPIANITGLGNGSPKAKADWIVGKVSEGYNDFYFADDHRGNVKAVKNALAPLDVKGKVQLAKVKFSMSTSQELTWKDTGEALVAKFKVGTRNYEVTLEETAFMEFDKGQTYQDIEDIAKELGISEDKDGDGIESSERFFHLEFGDTELGKGITGEGNAFKVFSTAINGVADYINKKKKIEGVIFTAKEPSRIRLYKTLSRALSEKINGSFSFKNNTFIVSKNPPVSDNISNQPKQVQDVLNTFDVKGKVQQARVKFSKSLDLEFNLMIERTKGIESVKEFSKIVAKRKGASIGRYKFLVPAAEDFRGLTSYTFAGKGKQGEADQKFFEDALITPYFRGVNAIGSERQTVKNDFRALSKLFKPTVKKLGKLIPDGDFTYDQAVRVYLWTQAGIEVPGLSKRDQAKLNKLVNKDAELVAFANAALLSSKKDTWIEPGDYWDTKTMLSDLNDLTEKVNRKEYLAEFIENVDIIFSEKNLNKVEAVYGTRHREALEDAIYSMKNGTNRTSGSNKITNKWNNWVNSSIGAIMFFNRRSATMQLLSTVNFINWSDNNPIKAGAAFANQPQYWKDFAMIFNSDKLKQRRGGLKSDIQESEIANAAKGSKDNASAILSYLLKIGFTPTQIADSFAISMGGASMYRNRVETYKKQGLDEKVAEEKAWLDFTKISDETQQSGDPILVSQQQRSVAGRLILSFQNTTMQYNRLMKKSAQDLVNRRGDPKTHISQIIYYGAVQNFIFNALSTSLFALIPGFDDDDDDDETKQKKEDKKAATVLNGMMDSLLRGTGIYGAVIAAVKNTIRKYYSEEEKGFTANHAYTLIEAANLSPAIGSKLRKLHTAMQTNKFEKDVIEKRGWDVTIDGKYNLSPKYSIVGDLAAASLNIPLDRAIAEAQSVAEVLDDRNTKWQRIALVMGWRTWNVGATNEEHDLIKADARVIRKEEGKEKAKNTRDKNKEIEKQKVANLTPEQRQKEARDKALAKREKAIAKRKAKYAEMQNK